MRGAILGFVVGVAILQTQAALPSPAVQFALMLVGVSVAALTWNTERPTLRRLALPLCGALLGFAWAALIARHTLAQELPAEWEGRDLTVIGVVDSLPYYFDQGVRFNLTVEKVIANDGQAPKIPRRLALSWYVPIGKNAVRPANKVTPGERWRLTVRLGRPHGNANPYGFDYEAWLLEQGLRATGYVRSEQDPQTGNQRLDDFVFSFGNLVERSRHWLRERIHHALPDKEYAGVIVALVIGDQRGIGQPDWKVFTRTGIGHLISISGLHITMIAGMFASVVLLLWRRSFFIGSGLPLLLPAQKAAALGGAGIAFVYVLLAGFGIPAQRTLYMLTVVAAALWFDRIASVSHILCIALGIVMLLDPWAVLWPGFWLSFGAVAVILYATVGRTQTHADPAGNPTQARWMAGLKSAAHTQYVVTLGLVPLTMLLFGQVSLVSPIANAVAIPVVSFLVTPLALAGSVFPAPLSGWMLNLAHFLVACLAAGLQWLSEWPVAVWTAPVPAWWIFTAALAGTLWLLAPPGWPLRWLGLVAWLPLLVNAPARPGEGEVWVTAFDIGQGNALLVETAHHRLLYDTGPAYSPESDGASRVILPYLRARGINALDGIVISHSDLDHSGGALSILGEIRVGWVSSSLPLDHAIVRAAPKHKRCEAGQAWTWDETRMEILHPGADAYEETKFKPNARSCTLRVTAGAHSILLPGDIEARQEAELVENEPERLSASVLLAPHHGSGTSSTLDFLRAVNPDIALFQVGYRNRYHHPKPEVFERYGELGITRLRSDESGAVMIRFGGTVEVSEYLREHGRYWQAR